VRSSRFAGIYSDGGEGGQETTESEGKSLTVLARMFFRIIARFYLRIEPVFIEAFFEL
jgi:hypothetical protein